MRRRGRWRRRGKWAGTVAAAVIVLVWFVSGWYGGFVTHAGDLKYRYLGVRWGSVFAEEGDRAPSDRSGLGLVGPVRNPGRRPGWGWVPWSQTDSIGFLRIYLPLWIPFLLIAAPTAWLWRLDRRRLPGACPRCGYDLAGIPPPRAVCPECGASPEAGRDR